MESVSMKTLFLVVLVVYCVYYFSGPEVEAVAGRYGGSRFGGSRTRYSTRTRYATTRVRNTRVSTGQRVRVRVRNAHYGTRYSRYRMSSGWNWQTAAAVGYIYGYSSYSRRRMYYRDRNREPSICTNKVEYFMTNGTQYTLFICPKEFQEDDHVGCCGPAEKQYCCVPPGYYDYDSRRSGMGGGSVAGVVIGLLILAIIIGVCCYCWRKGKKTETKSTVVEYRMTNTAPPPGGHTMPAAPAYQAPPPQPVPGATPIYPPPEPMPPQQPMYPVDPQMNEKPSAPAPAFGAAYPPNQPAYPPPPGGPGYPPGGPSYPPGGPGYPPDGPGYPPDGPGYPPAGGPPPYPANSPYPPGPTPMPQPGPY